MTTFYTNEKQKNQFEGWLSLKRKNVFLVKARRINLEALFSLKRKMRLFHEWHPFCHDAKIRSINFKALFSLKRKRVRFLNEMFFTDTQVKKMSFEPPFLLKRKGSVSWRKAFLPMQKSEGSLLKLYFHWREKSFFFEWHVFWQCKSFSPTNQGAPWIAYLFIHP